MLSLFLASVAIAAHQPTAELAVDLDKDDAATQWFFPEDSAGVDAGELVCDGRKRMSRAFFLPSEWEDVSLRAKFLVCYFSRHPGVLSASSCGMGLILLNFIDAWRERSRHRRISDAIAHA